MDALIRISLVLLFALLVGCSETKQAAKVFPETSQSCAQTAHPHRYIVKKVTGQIEIHNKNSREEMLQEIVIPQLQDIEFVEQDQKISKNDFFVSNFSSQENNSSQIQSWGPTRVQADLAWSQNIFGQNVIVAVIDSGVDVNHLALKNNIHINQLELNGKPGVDDDGNGYIDDIYGWNFEENIPTNNDEDGHGTHVAGIIAAEHSSPVKGVAPQAKIIPLDFMGPDGGFTSNGILAIQYAVSSGAKIINASWGSEYCSSLLNKEIQSLASKNVLFVAAAGNSGNNLNFAPEYPAAYVNPTQVTVSALTVRGFMAWFTNYGALSNVMAPGESIYSSIPGDKYEYLNGTSMAAPIVSGLAALLLSEKPSLTALDLKSILESSTKKGPFDVSSRGEVFYPTAREFALRK